MLFGTQKIVDNLLQIGGVSARDLITRHGSPLYVYDVKHIENIIDQLQSNFQSQFFNTQVAYAGKAFLTKAMCRLLEERSMFLDCVSIGEMYTAIKSGFTMNRSIIHGNNKSLSELNLAIDNQVAYIVVDSLPELELLASLAKAKQAKVNTLLRVNPGIEAHTHEYIVTAKLTSKFGESVYADRQLEKIAKVYKESDFVNLLGFHCHIGSQIFDLIPFIETIDRMIGFMSDFEKRYSVKTPVLDLGGGFGVYYTEADQPKALSDLLKGIIKAVETSVSKHQFKLEELLIEPGRSIVGNAGTTLYSIGFTKETYGGKNYLFVDGGMSDNIRPALYQAKYSCDIASNMNGIKSGSWTVAGKLCESGDILIKDTPLQEFSTGDILAVYTTGAYNYSMSSNYNRLSKPAVVFVKDGLSTEVVKRESLEDLLRNDL